MSRTISLGYLLAMAFLCPDATAKVFDSHEPMLKKLRPTPTVHFFHGLQFTVDPATTTCDLDAGKLICKIVRDNKGLQSRAEMIFEMQKVSSQAAANLIRFNRKGVWSKEHPTLNQYIETEATIGAFKTRVQEANFYRLNNIRLTVLLRALDVVTNVATVISVTTICDVSDWSAITESISNIENSFKKAGK